MFVSTALFASACASVMNPYEGDFTCPKTHNGKCVSINEAYEESINGKKIEKPKLKSKQVSKPTQDESFLDSNGMQLYEFEKPVKKLKENSEKENSLELLEPSEMYQDALYSEMSALIKEPVTPVVRVPNTVRVLLLPYKDDETEGEMLFMYRYVFFILEKPYWILDGYPNIKDE
ncbi:MAG: TraV family lipoprotein [Nitrospinota bacterium]|nr:TraV family lipoprotein [Nitrospinota bacterium]